MITFYTLLTSLFCIRQVVWANKIITTIQNLRKAACNRDSYNPCDINLFVSRQPRTKNWSYVEQALAYRTSILKVLLKPYKSPTGHTKFKHATISWNQSWIHNSVKKGSAIPNFEFELDLIVFKLYTKFQLNIYIGPKENERKPFLIWIF